MLSRPHALLCNQCRTSSPHAAPPRCCTSNDRPKASQRRSSSSRGQPRSSSCLCKCSTAGSGQQAAAPTPGTQQQRAEFKPRVLTVGLRRAATIQSLESLWHSFHQQFNSFHFSVLMQRLTKLHDAVSMGLSGQHTPAATHQQQQQHQHQASDASLAELERELGHLLDGDSNSSSQQGRQDDPAPAEARSRIRRVSWRTEQQQQPAATAGPAAIRPPLQVDRPQWRPPAGSSNSGSSSRVRGRQQQDAPRQQQQQHQHQQQDVSQQSLQRIHKLALTAAAAALQPGRAEPLDHRALVMVAHNLAKMQLHNSSILQQLLQALGPDVLPELDPQQLTNLIWSLGSCASSGQEDRSPYRTLLVPAVLSRPAPVVAVAAASATTSTASSSVDGGSSSSAQWERVAAVAEPAGPPDSTDQLERQAAAAAASFDIFADAVSITAPPAGSGSRLAQPPADWLSAAADALMQRLPECSSQGVAMSLLGFAQLGFSPPAAWWRRFWGLTQGSLPLYSAQDLSLLMCGIGKLGPKVPSAWLMAYCSAACDVLPSMSSQQLTMCLWGLAVSGASPHKAFVLLWFLTSIGLMQQATTQELSMWLYALTLLRLTPSPSWCAAFVEASFSAFTAADTLPQDLVTAMWSISRLGWSPPLLYWRGLMGAARERFERFGPQDLANCISAAAAVDTTCVTDAWLSAFLKASQTRLSAFEPVQLAHTANALTILCKSHASAHRLLTAAWQTAFVGAAAKHLAAGRFSLRNLVLVVTSMRLLRFKPCADVSSFLTEAELVLTRMWPKEARQQQQQLDEHQLDTQQQAAL